MFNLKSPYFWTSEQKDTLTQAYSLGGLKIAQEMLPSKSRATIATQASRMRITTPKPRKHKND
jgi:hypothetical protein